MSYSPYAWDIYQHEPAPDEKTLPGVDAIDGGDRPNGDVDPYQQTSDDEDYFRLRRILRDYEFQERGGILPGDCVMAEVAPGYWQRSVVLLVGTETLIVVCPNSVSGKYALEAPLESAMWMGEH